MHQNFGDRWPDLAVETCPEGGVPPRGQVIALHCSGADGNQWRRLAANLGLGFSVATPDFFSCGRKEPWGGEHAFTLMDEARPIIEMIDALSAPVHLVGHSYGGGVALKVATERPDRLASVSLYEPSAFHLLRQLGPEAGEPLAEIEDLAHRVGEGLLNGAYLRAAATFVDYWNGEGAWEQLKPSVRDALIRWLPKAALDFRALLEEDTTIRSYRSIDCPVLIMRGEHAPRPSRVLAENLQRILPDASLEIVEGAGHMGPVSHSAEVNLRIARHIQDANDRLANRRHCDLAA